VRTIYCVNFFEKIVNQQGHLYRQITSDKSKEINIEALSISFGEMLKLLADANMSHGDFKAVNFIVAGEKLYLIDIEGMCKHSCRWSLRRSLKRDCRRFMKNWKDIPKVARAFQNQIRKTAS